ncbi:hypothetical protein HYT53_03570 [Candidatus Woesearchaeota archaeon]|nr:hypothetical protein [Candidatus Woesearchaeota archaeon]
MAQYTFIKIINPSQLADELQKAGIQFNFSYNKIADSIKGKKADELVIEADIDPTAIISNHVPTAEKNPIQIKTDLKTEVDQLVTTAEMKALLKKIIEK